MPKIFQYLNFIIRFYTNEHLPIHVHVQLQDREMKVEFYISEDDVTLLFKKIRGRNPLSKAEANEIAVFLKAYFRKIVTKWEAVFIYHKKVKCETVARKLGRKN